MKKINNYIRYLLILLTLILLGSINVYAQTTVDLSQIVSQANQQLSNLIPSSTHSTNTASFSEIIKQNIDKFIYYFINYAIPFLFVFLVLFFLTHEAKKNGANIEISRPLLLLYLIMAFLATVFFHSVIIVLAIIFTIILIIVGSYKFFHGITGSIIGFVVAIVFLFVILVNDSLKEFLSSTAYFIILFILFIILFILGIRVHKEFSQYINKIKKDLDSLYHIIKGSKKPQEIQEVPREIQEEAKKIIDLFEKVAKDENFGIISKVHKINSLLNNLKMSKKLDKGNVQDLINLSREIKDNYKNFILEYNMIKEKFNNLYRLIERQYNEPIRSKILGILKETEEKIDNIKREVDTVYTHRYLQNEDLKRILSRWLKENVEKDIIKELKGHIKGAQTDLENFENTIKNLNISDIMDNKLKDGVKNIKSKMKNHKEKFDKKYREAESKLSKLRNSMPDAYNRLKSMVDASLEEFQKIYGRYNELADGLESFSNFISLIKDDIKDLENISSNIECNENVPENCRKFYDIYNKIMRDINSFFSQYSRGSPIYPLLRKKLEKYIENYQTKISDKCRQGQNFPHQWSFHYRWS
ncbi:MAG: hypothetical protein ACO2ON_01190 [Candidatus Nanopusillus sp.]